VCRKCYDVETDDDVGTLPYRNAVQTGYFPRAKEALMQSLHADNNEEKGELQFEERE
jgi:hypothetical protein